jgi:hypothetical protein
MKFEDFINQSIGRMVYVTCDKDLKFNGNLSEIISNKTELRLLKWTKSGNVYLHDEVKNKYYTVPPSNVRKVSV